ncbi:hypothetical protein GGS26DRAFT_587971 [Hypomontagnella submonticulosa]|nr:hypothetical protein GGS26DRAFT_587971 [Hypomontagnella submonticulosa]
MAMTSPAVRTVSAEWNVPWIKVRDGLDLSNLENRHSLAQWVGIIGFECRNSSWFPFLRAGTAVDVRMLSDRSNEEDELKILGFESA